MPIARADGKPTKGFFVRMITRDIALEDCILDLIDNSVDAAWKQLGSKLMSLEDNQDLSLFTIMITASEDRFEISDNCGGISLDDAVEYAFTFGRKEDDESEDFSIGVYGIGMKRAIFKIGKKISIVSTFSENGTLSSFLVPVDVDEWLKRADKTWDFDIDASDHLQAPGVQIRVSELNEDTRMSFASPGFLQRLKRTVSRDYSLHLARGLNIVINNEIVRGWQLELLESDLFKALRHEYSENTPNGLVRVEFLAGMAAEPLDDSNPDPQDRDEDRDGWYVVCNGRTVVAADKTSLTGWGTDNWPKWHPQYYGFMGIVMFTSENAVLLPLTTTKRSVDTSSGVYRRALPTMREVSKAWIAYSYERKQSLDEARAAEAAAAPVRLRNVPKYQSVALPKYTPVPVEPSTTISYSMPKRRVKALAEAYGNVNLPNREVGRRSFEDAYSDLVGED